MLPNQLEPKRLWLTLYIWLTVLCPPFYVGSKSFYAAEWMLVPALALLLWKLINRPRSYKMPPGELIFLWIALVWTLIAGGLGRGDWPQAYTQYPLSKAPFSVLHESIQCVRWGLILATPWLFFLFFRSPGDSGSDRENHLSVFFKTLENASIASALVSIFGFFKILNLETIYGYDLNNADWWRHRSFGTFTAPLEASLFYGAVCAYAFSQILDGASKQKRLGFQIFVLILNGIAFALCGGGTGIICLIITTAWLAHRKIPRARTALWLSVTAAMVALFLSVEVFKVEALRWKFSDLMVRSLTWQHWLESLPQAPHLIFTGIGFSGLVVDSSVLAPLVTGGIIFAAGVFCWIRRLHLNKLFDFDRAPILLFWVISWLDLDSMGYWGLGRLCWLLMGILWSQNEGGS